MCDRGGYKAALHLHNFKWISVKTEYDDGYHLTLHVISFSDLDLP